MKILTNANHPNKGALSANHTFFLLTVFILTLMSSPVFADSASGQSEGWHMMGSGYGHEFGTMHGLFGVLWMVLIFGGLIALIIFAVRGFRISHTGITPPTSTRTPLEILKERYAQGDIESDEFEDRKKRLAQ